MTAPWTGQPTPLVDAKTCDGEYTLYSGGKCTLQAWEYKSEPTYGEVVMADTARAIEQRMRHVEALLMRVEQAWPIGVVIGDYKAISLHLAAAKEMDGAK